MSIKIVLDSAGNWTGAQGPNDDNYAPSIPPGGSLVIVAALPDAYLLKDAKAAQIAKVSASCSDAITSGFTSAALGTTHTYPSNDRDQVNLIGGVSSGLAIITFWCADSAGSWARVDHTAVQIKQVLADAGTQRMAYSAKLKGLVDQINAATHPGAVSLINW